jgi:hypothetical protein
MPETMISPPAVDSRISGIPPQPPLRLALGHSDEDEERKFMRAVLRHYVWQFGAEAVIRAVREIAGGDQ